MSIPLIETDHLIIREFVAADADAHRQISEQSFNISIAAPDHESWMRWTLLNYRELDKLYQPPYGDRAVVLKTSGDLIGIVGVVPSIVPWGVIDTLRAPDEPPNYLVSPEFGLFWAIRADQRGKGYAGEAAHTIIDYLFQTMHVRRVIATTEHANAASQRVMQKLGMTIHRNPSDKPFWFEVVGVLDHPWHKRDIMSSTAGR